MIYESDWTGSDSLGQSGLHEALNAAGVDCSVHGYCQRIAGDRDASRQSECDQDCGSPAHA